MYRGFNLTLDSNDNIGNDFYEIGKKIFKAYSIIVKRTLNSFALKDGALDGSKMQSNWFRQVNTDIFISHSHKDQKKAIALAGWLFKTFHIKAFVDSCIWGYSNELLEIIDKKYCSIKGSNTYNYESRNYSTSHVHMMLSTALSMMIDKTECLFFLNTPNSISTSEIISTTESPWIYFEIATSKLIRQNTPLRRKLADTKIEKKAMTEERLKIKYVLNMKHLTSINLQTLKEWGKGNLLRNNALDELYKLKPQTGKKIIL